MPATDDHKLLDALRKALHGEPRKLTGAGTPPGLFPGGAAGLKLATLALDHGYVEDCPPPTPPIGKAAPARYARITDKGRQFVADSESPKQALERLAATLDGGAAELAGRFSGLDDLFADVRQSVERMNRLLHDVNSAVSRAADGPPERASTPTPPDDGERMAPAVRAYLKGRTAPGDCPLPELYAHLRGQFGGLSIGGFHDLMRRLHSENQVRLTGYSNSLERMQQSELAIVHSNKVMYYAHVPG